MRSLFTLIVLPLATSGLLSATPRINQISPNPDLTGRHQFADVDGNSFDDIVADSPFGPWSIPILIRNLGNRAFASPEQIFYLQSGVLPDKNFTFIELTGPGDFRMLVNQGSITMDPFNPAYIPPSSPLVIPLDKPGTYGERTALAPEGPRDWIPVDLDGDRQSEFVHVEPAPDDKTKLTIHDRQSDGTYSATVIMLDAEIEADRATAIDLDNDSDLDLVLGSNGYSQLLRRTGTRSFEAQVRQAPLYSPKLTDLNGDGLPDFHSNTTSPFIWIINLGDFTFGYEQSRDVFPGDDNYHLFAAAPQPGEHATLQFKEYENRTLSLKSMRFGEWGITSEHTVDCSSINPASAWQPPSLIANRDLDKDGHPDLAFLAHNNTGNSSSNRLAIAWGNAGGFEPPVYTHASPITFQQLLVADFDSQKGPDFIAGPDGENHYWFFGNDGTGNFDLPLEVTALDLPTGCPPGTEVSSIEQADFTNDGIPDLAIVYSRFHQNHFQTFCGIAQGNGDGTFVKPVLPPGAFDTLASSSAEIENIIDWDGDGDLDIIGNGEWRENINGSFALESTPLIDGAWLTDILGNPVRNIHTRVGDIDGDGHNDIISLVYRFTGEEIGGGIVGGLGGNYESVIAVGFNDGNGGIEEIAEIPITMHTADILGNPVIFDLRIADVNSDGRADICHQQAAGTDIYGNPLTTTKWRRNPGGAAARNPSLWLSLPYGRHDLPDSLNPRLDFDGDGRKDWATPNGYVRPGPSGPVISATYDFTGNAKFSIYSNVIWQVADFDGDGDTDALYTDGYQQLSLVRNPLVDERSPITRHLVAAGSTGKKAQPLSDADGDGRDNQTELLFGTDPLTKDSAPANPLGVNFVPGGNGNSLSFSVPGYASSLGLHYEVQRSTDLADWTPLEGASPDFISNSGGWNRMNLPLECSGPCGYFRIRGIHKTE